MNGTPALSNKKKKIKTAMSKIRNMRKMQQSDFKFFEYPTEDYLIFMEEYSKMDIARGTNFKETFPELEWLYK